MLIRLEEILKNPLFCDARILTGTAGLSRSVRRISVFDCLCSENLIELGIMSPGDLFITDLTQFTYNKENIYPYINALIQANSSGLLVVTDEMLHVLTEDILLQCKENCFPIVLIPQNYPYAQIIDMVNRYITADSHNTINSLKLERIMCGQMSENEKLSVLTSINPNIETYLRVINVDGSFVFDSSRTDLEFYYLKQKQDIYVKMEHAMTFILSAKSEKLLRHHSDSTTARLQQYIREPIFGYSRIYDRKKIDIALDEAARALKVAKTMRIQSTTYNPLSVLQLLLSLKDTREAYDFYHAYVKAIRHKFSADALEENLLTIENFVAHNGNYAETAKAMNQHENTIRYRVNRVKEALGFETNNIGFYETIALAVKLRVMLDNETP